ncbi:hypothetical protein [Streptomyces sp. NBC_01477]|uniref:hypothetical protein n=1 Tax=Streptomyces sp. NBC_01477 TaxID=2976015 RepID=UPI002E334006|nr:hypothetical protein [Streptomyces sp. NBC_01477]
MGLPPAWERAAHDKLRFHTATNPTREYDTVLSHLLVWSDQYGDPASDFHRTLVGLVEEARRWRTAGGAMAAQPSPGVTAASALERLMALAAAVPDGPA